MRRRLWIAFTLILLLVAAAGYVARPATVKLFGRNIELRRGLDLKGGIHLVYEADTSKVGSQSVSSAMEGAQNVIESRVNFLGATEPDIRISSIGSKPAIVIDLPGFEDQERAKALIGSTAKLEFQNADGSVIMDGSDLVPGGAVANVQQSASSSTVSNSAFEVDLKLTDGGRQKFAAATTANVGKRIGILLDGQVISAPTVQQAITDGNVSITGNFTAAQATDFAGKLNAGALPIPISLVQEQTVGASLGADAVSASLLAGLIGIILIFFFIVAYYRWAGLLASLALVVYALLNIAAYKLLSVTMTLAGIAGFIISMGIAVDTNILTFERLKEELRLGKPVAVAIQEAFRRAWTSIRDSHISGLISATIIALFASGSVRGFAFVLIIGTLLSLFSAITVTRVWMLLLAGSRFRRVLAIATPKPVAAIEERA